VAITCDYRYPDNQDVVNYHFDADSMTFYPADHPDVVAFVAGGGTIHAYITPATPEPVPPSVPTLVCLANLMIDDGDVQLVEAGATGLAFAFAAAPNVIWAYFTDEMPDGLYNPNVNSTSGSARITDRQTDHVEITIDAPTEPYTLFIQVFRTT
jgi:hypothetical protein